MGNNLISTSVTGLFVILLSVFVGITAAFCDAGIIDTLESLYAGKASFQVKKHLKLAISFYQKSRQNSFVEEIKFLRQIDPESEEIYTSILDNKTPTSPAPVVTFTAPQSSPTPAIGLTPEEKTIADKLLRAGECYAKSKIPEAVTELQSVITMDRYNKEAKEFLALIEKEAFVTDTTKPFQGIVKQLFDEAMALYRRGNYKEAEEKMQRAAETDPMNKQVTEYLSLISEKLEGLKGEQDVEEALAKADKLRFQAKYQQARSLYEKVLTVDGSNTKANHYIAEFNSKCAEFTKKASLLAAQKMVKEARKEIATALDYNPSDEETIALKSRLDLEYADQLKAEKEKKRINKVYNEGVNYYGKGEYKKAIDKWEEVLKFNPQDTGAAGNIEKAKEKLMEKSESDSTDIKDALAEAVELAAKGLVEKAEAKYEYVLRLDPQNAEAAAGLEEMKAIKEAKVEQLNRR